MASTAVTGGTKAQQQAKLDSNVDDAVDEERDAKAAADAGPGSSNQVAHNLLDSALQVAVTARKFAISVASKGPVPQKTTVIKPRCGGVEDIEGQKFAWTGGGGLPTTERTIPSTAQAVRPRDYKSWAKTEKECQQGLAVEHHLSTPDKSGKDDKLSLQAWIDRIKVAIEDKGMDPVFRIVNGTGATRTEDYILEEFGMAKIDTVKQWVVDLLANSPQCPYDVVNLKMSASMILKSADSDLLKRIDRELPQTASGPEVFAVIVSLHQTLNSIAVRVLIKELEGLHLTAEPAENVEKFSDKVLDVAKRIRGAGPTKTCPDDLCTLVYECFQDCTTPVFQIEATNLYWKAQIGDASVADWEHGVTKLKANYRLSMTRGTWQAAKHHKEKAEVQALVAIVKTLKKEMSDLKTGPKTSHASGGSSDTRTCYHCGKAGHIKPNCPDKDKPAKAGGGRGTTGTGTVTKTEAGKKPGSGNPKYKAPTGTEPHTKTDAGITYKWCGKCKRWIGGEKAHLTAEHVSTKKPADESPAAAALVAQEDDSTGSLRFISGFMGAVSSKEGESGDPPPDYEAWFKAHIADSLLRQGWYCTVCKEKSLDVCVDVHERSFKHQEALLPPRLPADVGKIFCEPCQEFVTKDYAAHRRSREHQIAKIERDQDSKIADQEDEFTLIAPNADEPWIKVWRPKKNKGRHSRLKDRAGQR